MKREIVLPAGFQPESAAVSGHLAYLGSLADGSIYRVDLRDGTGATVGPTCGVPAGGLRRDPAGLIVAGGFSGTARVVDAASGLILASYRLAQQPTLVADVILTDTAAWFTDAFNPALYCLPFGPDGELPHPDAIGRVDLAGEVAYGQGFNLLGIERTPDRTGILTAHCDHGRLYRVDTSTGVTTEVPIAGGDITGVDGLFLSGTTLYAALGGKNAVAVMELDAHGSQATLVTRITDPGFDIPTATFVHDGRLYVVNSKLDGRDLTPQTPYTVAVVEL